jgi:phosphoribosylcarboxyaminoimidazole (NCAIR) mutase
MGHICTVARTMEAAEAALARITGSGAAALRAGPPAQIGVVLVAPADATRARAALQELQEAQVGFDVALLSALEDPDELLSYGRQCALDTLLVSDSDGGVAAAMLARAAVCPVVLLPLGAGGPASGSSVPGVASVGPGRLGGAGGDSNASAGAVEFALRILAVADEALRQWLAERAAAKRDAFRRAVAQVVAPDITQQ